MASQLQNRRTLSLAARRRTSEDEWYRRVSRKAFELYQQRGEEPGHDIDDWLTAERLVQDELRHGPFVPDPIREDDDLTEDGDVPP
jgi:hypothetical protein